MLTCAYKGLRVDGEIRRPVWRESEGQRDVPQREEDERRRHSILSLGESNCQVTAEPNASPTCAPSFFSSFFLSDIHVSNSSVFLICRGNKEKRRSSTSNDWEADWDAVDRAISQARRSAYL